jgi:hypothetical protein
MSQILRFLQRRSLIWGDSLDCFDGTAVSLGSEPSSPLPIRFGRCPQMLNTTSQSKCMRWHPRQRAGSTRPLWFLRFPFLHMRQSREPASITSFLMTSVKQYGCPVEEPSPSNPNPQQDTSNGQGPRYRRKSYCPYVSVP